MITADSALKLINKYSRPTSAVEQLAVVLAEGKTLAKDVYSPIDMPPFHQSAMDGYALSLSEDAKSYKLVGEIKAGDGNLIALNPGEAVRIFTGAAVPETANSVVMQEKVTVKNREVTLDFSCLIGSNIRPKGEQITKGKIALEKGQRLNPAAIGFLESLGIGVVEVSKKPIISLVITGDELVPSGQKISYGQVYESNVAMLLSALRKINHHDIIVHRVKDNLKNTQTCIEKAILESDLLLISGGISVGDYDFTAKALHNIGVETIFYKVRQKPGKPLYFGMMADKTSVFALPGNPASALTCFYVYVYPFLLQWEGVKDDPLRTITLPSLSNFEKKGGYTQFLKSKILKDGIDILDGQSSAMLHTYAKADALAVIPEDISIVKKGQMISVIPLPI